MSRSTGSSNANRPAWWASSCRTVIRSLPCCANSGQYGRDPLVVVEPPSRVRERQRHRREALRRRIDEHHRVALPGGARGPVSYAAPDVDDRFALVVGAARAAQLPPAGEVLGERGAHAFEVAAGVSLHGVLDARHGHSSRRRVARASTHQRAIAVPPNTEARRAGAPVATPAVNVAWEATGHGQDDHRVCGARHRQRVRDSSWACESAKSPVQPSTVCSFAIAPASQAFTEAGGSGSVAVATTAGCSWSAASSVDWVAVTAGSAGAGPGAVAYTVLANDAPDARTGAVTVEGQRHTVTQSGRPPIVCSFELDPRSVAVGKDAVDGAFSVITTAGCALDRDEHRVVAGRGRRHAGVGPGPRARTRSRATRASSRAMPASRSATGPLPSIRPATQGCPGGSAASGTAG